MNRREYRAKRIKWFFAFQNYLLRNGFKKKLNATRDKSTAPTTLTEPELDDLVRKSNMSREDIVNFYSNFLLDCPNGRMGRADFERLFFKLNPNRRRMRKHTDRFCQHIFKALDTSSKDYLTFNELMTFISISSFDNCDNAEKIKLAFKIYDSNKDGMITKYEICKVLGSLFNTSINRPNDQFNIKKGIDFIFKKFELIGREFLEFQHFETFCASDKEAKNILVDLIFD